MSSAHATGTRGLLIAGILFGAILCGAVGLSSADSPGEPASFYGSATEADGTDVPADERIVAVVDNETRGEIVIEDPGEYGGPGAFDDKLRVDSSTGEEVTFRLTDENGTAAATVPLEPGVSEESLVFPNGTVPTGDDGGTGDASVSGDDDGGDTTSSGGGSVGSDGSGGGTATGSGGSEGGTETGSGGSDDESSGASTSSGSETTGSSGTAAQSDDPTDTSEAFLIETRRIEDASPDAPGTTVAFEETSVREILLETRSTGGAISIAESTDPIGDAPGIPGNAPIASASEITVPAGHETDDATVRAVVTEAWIAEHGIDPEYLTMYRLPDGADRWEALPSETFDIEGGYAVEARTPGFSQFVVAGREPPSERPGHGASTRTGGTDLSTATTTVESPDIDGSGPTGDGSGSGRFDGTDPIVLVASLCAILLFVAAVGRFLIPRRRNDW